MAHARESLEVSRTSYGDRKEGQTKVLTLTPSNSKDASPIILFPGYMGNGNEKAYHRFAAKTAEATGRRVDLVTHGAMRLEELDRNAQAMGYAALNGAYLDRNKAAGVSKHVQEAGIESAIVVAHSHGNHAGLQFVERQSDLIEGMVALSPAALNEKLPMPFLSSLLPRFTVALSAEVAHAVFQGDSYARAGMLGLLSGGAELVVTHPSRMLEEGKIIAAADYREVFAQLNEGETPRGIVVAGDASDPVFGASELSKDPRIRREMVVYRGSHCKPLTDPQFADNFVAPAVIKVAKSA